MVEISIFDEAIAVGEAVCDLGPYDAESQRLCPELRGRGWVEINFGTELELTIYRQKPESLEELGRKLIEAGESLRRQLAEQTSPAPDAPDALVTA